MTDPSPIPGPVPPAGWYGDPAHPARQRWWDGQTWSDQVRGAGPQPDAPPAMTGPQPPAVISPWRLPGQPPRNLMAPAGLIRMGTPTTTDGVALATFGRRFFATIIDNVVVSVVVSFVLQFVIDDFQTRVLAGMDGLYQVLRSGQGEVSADFAHLQMIMMYGLIAATLVYGLVTLSLWSRTLGQRIVGIAVCPAETGLGRIGWRQAIPRTLLWTLLSQGTSFLVLIHMMSVSLVLWHPKRQTLPDLLARTQVVRR